MSTAFIIAGPPSAGNRLVAAALARSCCAGSGSCDQPRTRSDIPRDDGRNLVVIKHRKLDRWIQAIYSSGYCRIVVIVIVREPVANCRSLVDRGHVTDLESAGRIRNSMIARNIADGLKYSDQLEVITYEGLTEDFLSQWLPSIGLEYKPGPLDLPDQETPATIQNQNAKHYAECH